MLFLTIIPVAKTEIENTQRLKKIYQDENIFFKFLSWFQLKIKIRVT